MIREGNAATAAAAVGPEIKKKEKKGDPGVLGVTTEIPVRRDPEKSSQSVRMTEGDSTSREKNRKF